MHRRGGLKKVKEEYTCCWSSCTVLCKVGLCTYMHKVTIQLNSGWGLVQYVSCKLKENCRQPTCMHYSVLLYNNYVVL